MSRVWARTDKPGKNGKRQWVALTGNEAILAWLQQALLLELGESPFWTDWGIPALKSLRQGNYPDLYMQKTKERFEPYFRSLNINRNVPDNPEDQINYTINAIPYSGSLTNGTETKKAPRGT